jgi:hypothetical protein
MTHFTVQSICGIGMSNTLSKIRAKKDHANDSQVIQNQSEQVSALKRSQAAIPLLNAFNDIKGEFVRIELLKQIWPKDFDRRNDRLVGLVMEVLGGETYPYGLKFYIPGGYRSFAVELGQDESLIYTTTREADSGKPQYVTFRDQEQWMDFFYKTMAYIIDV